MRAHARWWNLVASHEATDTLYREMCLALYLPGGMVVAITVKSATLYYIVYNRLTSFYLLFVPAGTDLAVKLLKCYV